MRNTLEHKITKAEVLLALSYCFNFIDRLEAIGDLNPYILRQLFMQLEEDDVFNAVFSGNEHFEKALPR